MLKCSTAADRYPALRKSASRYKTIALRAVWFLASVCLSLNTGLPRASQAGLQADEPENAEPAAVRLEWREMPALPDPLGLAGPLVGVFGNTLLVGGGANFATPVWENEKQWHDRVYALDLAELRPAWKTIGRLQAPLAYAACVSTPLGIVMLGGNDAHGAKRDGWLLKLNDRGQLLQQRLPDLPEASINAQACLVGDTIYLVCGQSDSTLASATAATWRLNLIQWRERPHDSSWERVADCPGGPRAYSAVAALREQQGETIWVIGGRREQAGMTVFLRDLWRFDPQTNQWQQKCSAPVPIAAGGAGPIGPNRIAVISGDDGKLFTQADALRDRHPGFVKRAWLYDAARDQWTSGGATPANQVTTTPVALPGRLILASGEVRPRVRTNQVWEIVPSGAHRP